MTEKLIPRLSGSDQSLLMQVLHIPVILRGNEMEQMFCGTATAIAMSTKRIKTRAFKHTRMQGLFRQLVSTCYCS